jgi:hypothetical protein
VLKAKGNSLFNQHNWKQALHWYSRAGRCAATPLQRGVVHLNKSVTLLELKRFSEAQREANEVALNYVGVEGVSEEKALFRFFFDICCNKNRFIN